MPIDTPITTSTTPESKKKTLTKWMLWPQPRGNSSITVDVSIGLPKSSGSSPVPAASSSPAAMSVRGCTGISAMRAFRPQAIENTISDTAAISPPMNPPPGALCPLSIMYAANTSDSGRISRAAV